MKSSSVPVTAVTACRTRIPWAMTSGPMPSPGMTAIRNGIGYSIIGPDLEKVFGPLADTLHSADGRKGPERGAGQDAPPAPGSPPFGAYLLGGVGMRRPGVPPAAGRRHRRVGFRLEAPTLPPPVFGALLCSPLQHTQCSKA